MTLMRRADPVWSNLPQVQRCRKVPPILAKYPPDSLSRDAVIQYKDLPEVLASFVSNSITERRACLGRHDLHSNCERVPV